MTKYHVASRFIMSALKDRNVVSLTNMVQVCKEILTYWSIIRDPFKKIQHLLTLIHDARYMCCTKDRDNSYIVGDILWTHPDFVKLLNMFHMILIFVYHIKSTSKGYLV